MILTISEVVSSIKGEGKNAGCPTTFIHLHGCNLSCSYCSKKCVTGKKKRMSVTTILSYVFKMGNMNVDILGGEPLLQENTHILLYDLVERGYNVTIYTNGSKPIDDVLYVRSYSYCMELKCPSSNMDSKNLYSNLAVLHPKDEVKFQIKDVEDYVFAKEVIKKYPTKASFIFSPLIEDDKHIGKDLAQWLIEDKIPRARLGVPIQQLLK